MTIIRIAPAVPFVDFDNGAGLVEVEIPPFTPPGNSLEFRWDSATADSDPGSGYLRANNVTLASATALYVDNLDRFSNNVSAWLSSFDDGGSSAFRGEIKLSARDNEQNFALFAVTGSIVAGGYRKITVAWVGPLTPPIFTDGMPLTLAFVRAGANGAAGPAGGDSYNIASVALAKVTTTIPLGVTFLWVAGYATNGDGGDALYIRVGGDPGHPFSFQDGNGIWWEGKEPYLDPLMIGCPVDPGNNSVDARLKWKDLIAAKSALGIPVIFNDRFYFGATGDQIDPGLSLTLIGRDPSRAILSFHEGEVSDEWRSIFNNVDNPDQQSLGPNLITNGYFAADSNWTKGTGWTIASGKATRSNTGTASSLTQAVTLVAGASYQVTFHLKNRVTGTVTPRYTGGTTVTGTARSANNDYTETIVVHAGGNTTLDFLASTDFAGSIDNVYVRKINAGQAKGAVVLENFTVLGTRNLGGRNDDDYGRAPFYMWYYPQLLLRGLRFLHCTAQAMTFQWCTESRVMACVLKNIGRGAIFLSETTFALVIGNFIEGCGDDAISLHTNVGMAGNTPSYSADQIATNNVIRNSGGAIKSLGGRRINIADNLLELCNNKAIEVGDNTGLDGNQSIHAVRIAGNFILDMHKIDDGAEAQGAITISIDAARGDASTHDVMPTRYDSTAADFIYPWNYHDKASMTWPAAVNLPVPPAEDLSIVDNIIARTRPATAAFSDYGFGPAIRFGIDYDDAMTDAILRPDTGIDFRGGSLHKTRIAGNLISHTKRAIGIIPGADRDMVNGDINALMIADNVLFDFTEYGVRFTNSAATIGLMMSVTGNWVDGDYYRKNTNSNIDGTYDANGLPFAFHFGTSGQGAIVEGNVVTNVCQVMNGPTDQVVRNNTLYCDVPVVVGTFDIGNRGVGNVPRSNAGWTHVIIDADPTSVDYKKVRGTPLDGSTVKPTAGYYMPGHFVRNQAPAISTGEVLLGWTRLTLPDSGGTNHVANTDWSAAWAENAN